MARGLPTTDRRGLDALTGNDHAPDGRALGRIPDRDGPFPQRDAALTATMDESNGSALSSAEPARRRPTVSIVVPTFNEERRLPESFRQLRGLAAEQRWGSDVEVIVVDDGSTDRTVAAARNDLDRFPQGRLLRLPWHAGKGAAVRLGVASAHGDAIVFMDADLATELSALPRGLEALRRADVVIGSRAAPGAVVTGRSKLRRTLHRTFGAHARRLAGVPASDPQCGFKAFRSEAAKILFPMSRVDGFGFDVEILLLAQKVGFRVEEIPVRWHAVEGSHIHVLRDPLIMLRDVLRVRLRYHHKVRVDPPGPAAASATTSRPGEGEQ
jgi:glycosyltransferase involved in cell wall biosynthesis